MKRTEDVDDKDFTDGSGSGFYIMYKTPEMKEWIYSPQKVNFDSLDYSNDEAIDQSKTTLFCKAIYFMWSILGNDVSGVYKYPQNCEKSNCVYFVEWKTFGEHVHFTIITEVKDSISVGLSTAEHSVSLNKFFAKLMPKVR